MVWSLQDETPYLWVIIAPLDLNLQIYSWQSQTYFIGPLQEMWMKWGFLAFHATSLGGNIVKLIVGRYVLCISRRCRIINNLHISFIVSSPCTSKRTWLLFKHTVKVNPSLHLRGDYMEHPISKPTIWWLWECRTMSLPFVLLLRNSCIPLRLICNSNTSNSIPWGMARATPSPDRRQYPLNQYGLII